MRPPQASAPGRDEVGYIPFDPAAANLILQLVSARYERASQEPVFNRG